MNTTDLNSGNDILKDLKRNAPINNNAKDGYLTETYKNKPTENTLDYKIDVYPLLYYDRNNLKYNNKVLDQNKGIPVYDYEANGGRQPEYFTTGLRRTGLNYSTPPLQRTSSRY